MKQIRSAALAIAVSSGVLASPHAASAASADHTYNLRTRIVAQAPASVGEFDGSLQLHVSAGGIVSGYYRPDDNARFIAVTGGVKGDRFWIDLGSFSVRPLRFDGTLGADGRIVAQSAQPYLDDGQVTGLVLTAVPKAS